MGFMDFASSVFGGGNGNQSVLARMAVPALASIIAKKKRSINPAEMSNQYRLMADQAKAAGDFARTQSDFYTSNYLPQAKAFSERAAGVGNLQDRMQYATRAGADHDQAFSARMGAIERSLGRNPNSGAYGAARGALEASYAPGKIFAMNSAMAEREQYGDTLRNQSLQHSDVRPAFGTAGLLHGSAGSGMAGLSREENNQYRQRVGDITAALRDPNRIATDSQKRQASQQDDAVVRANVERILREMGY